MPPAYPDFALPLPRLDRLVRAAVWAVNLFAPLTLAMQLAMQIKLRAERTTASGREVAVFDRKCVQMLVSECK